MPDDENDIRHKDNDSRNEYSIHRILSLEFKFIREVQPHSITCNISKNDCNSDKEVFECSRKNLWKDKWQQDKPPNEILHRIDLIKRNKNACHQIATENDIFITILDDNRKQTQDLWEERNERTNC